MPKEPRFPYLSGDFNCYAPDTNYDDQALRSSLEAGILDESKHMMVHLDHPASS